MSYSSRYQRAAFRISRLKFKKTLRQWKDRSYREQTNSTLMIRNHWAILSDRIAASRHSSVGRAFARGMIGLPFEPHQCVVAGQVCGRDRLGCHAGCQEVSRCCTRGESHGICNMYASTKHE